MGNSKTKMTDTKLGKACITMWVITFVLVIVSGILRGILMSKLGNTNYSDYSTTYDGDVDKIKTALQEAMDDYLVMSWASFSMTLLAVMFFFISLIITISWAVITYSK